MLLHMLFRIFVAFTIFVRCEAGMGNIIAEVFLRMNVIQALSQTCGSDPQVNRGIKLLKSDLKGVLNFIYKSKIDSVTSQLTAKALREGELPPLKDPQQAVAIANHLCQTKNFGENLKAEMLWYETTGKVEQSDGASSGRTNDSVKEEILAQSDIAESINQSESQNSFTSRNFEILMVGLLIGSVMAHYFYLLKNSANASPAAGKSIRRPEL